MLIDIDTDQLVGLVARLDATKQQFDKAFNSTIRKMAKWCQSRSIKDLSSQLGIPPSVLRRRIKPIRFARSKDGTTVDVFYGLANISWIHLKAKQNAAGVRAGGGRFRKSAFIATANSATQVFERDGRFRRREVNRKIGGGVVTCVVRRVEGIRKVTEDIKDPAQLYIEDKLLASDEFNAQFLKTFEHELKWQIRKSDQ